MHSTSIVIDSISCNKHQPHCRDYNVDLLELRECCSEQNSSCTCLAIRLSILS